MTIRIFIHYDIVSNREKRMNSNRKADFMTTTIAGRNAVREALMAQLPIQKIYIAKQSRRGLTRILEMAHAHGIPVRELDRPQLDKMAPRMQHQGVLAQVGGMSYTSFDLILDEAAERRESHLIAVLDEIKDPHNLGAIIRSADAMGFHGVVIPRDRSVGLTATVVKTSAGATAHVKVARVANLSRFLDELKEKGVWIAGLDHEGDRQFDELDPNLPLAIVIGSEGIGMRRLTREKCDFLIRIPMHGKINSLNASVAAAIAFWEIRRLRSLH